MKGQKTIIRPVQLEDIPLLVKLYFPWSTPEETVEKWKRYLDEQTSGIRTACVIVSQNEIVGYGSLLRYSEYAHFRAHHIPEINDLWIYEPHRRKGFASLLIAHLEQLATHQGFHEVGLGVGLYRDYVPAQKLYFRLGYEPAGEGITYKNITVTAGEKYPVDDDLIFWLTKKLASDGACT